MWVCLGTKQLMELAGRGCDISNPSSTVLNHLEIHSLQRTQMKKKFDLAKLSCSRLVAAKSSGLSLQCRSSRAHQTALTSFRSCHLRGMTLVQGVKSFFTCPCFSRSSSGLRVV
ncbi:uncharacterized protein TNCV_4360151 [Trichonephila clavipes]|uniref:Uncharacterized protein n=1 Tax=Trichonephila clavipes TaxID=2585209 RepID=A0A8X6WA62_TRICX|nr:uncharacterized protein TNCV_4360151 [Trichonephila clavipes]